MKISELMEKLGELQGLHGDVTVTVAMGHEISNIGIIGYLEKELGYEDENIVYIEAS